MSPTARRMLRRMTAKVLFSLGYLDRRQGRRGRAAWRFLQSLGQDFNKGRALISIAAALFSVGPRR